MQRHLGLRFVYETIEREARKSPGSKEAPAQFIPADLSAIPVQLSARLKDAALDADMERVEEVIDEIGAINEELGEKLTALAKGFDYGKIFNIIEEADGDCHVKDDT